MAELQDKRLTIFAVPKAFSGHIGCIQRNAVRSWRQLGEQVQILLFGDEAGTGEMAREVGAVHVPQVELNAQGTPLLNGVFAEAHRQSDAPYLIYTNSDIILLDDVWTALGIVVRSACPRFLMTGKRTDLEVTSTLGMETAGWQQQLKHDAAERGVHAFRGCKDYFIFPRSVFETIPAFAVGRGNWDNWMVHDAKVRQIPVIDGTEVITAIHQNHTYSHTKGSRKTAYVTGVEALENKRLGRGQHIISGSTPSHVIRDRQLKTLSSWASAWLFWSELPAFLKLLRSFYSAR